MAAALAAASAQATPIRLDGRETNLQQIVNNLTGGRVSSVDVVNDQRRTGVSIRTLRGLPLRVL
jgi:hypothetical protein